MFLNHRDDIAPAPASSGVVSGLDAEANDGERSEEASPETKEPDGRVRSDARASERRTRAEADRLRRRVFSQLSMTPPAGAKFAEAVSLALRRERHWTRWKRENCRAFERAPEPGGLDAVPAPEPESLSRRSDGRADVGARRVPKKRFSADAKDADDVVSLGNPELDRLWNLPLRDVREERTNEDAPSASSFLRGVHEDADPEAHIEEPYKRKNDAAFRWRLTRLLAAEDIGAFIKLHSEDLEAVAAEALDLPPWPAKTDENKNETPEEEETPRDAEADADAKAEAPAADGDGDGDGDDGDGGGGAEGDDGVPEEAEKKKRAVTTKTKTGGGEHTRFASTPATTDEFGGDSDMGSDSDGRALMAEVG